MKRNIFYIIAEPVLDDFCFLPKEMTFDDFCSILNLNDKELFCRNAFEKCYGIDLKYSIKCHKMHYTGTSSTFFIMLYCLSLTGSKLLIYSLFWSQFYINIVKYTREIFEWFSKRFSISNMKAIGRYKWHFLSAFTF